MHEQTCECNQCVTVVVTPPTPTVVSVVPSSTNTVTATLPQPSVVTVQSTTPSPVTPTPIVVTPPQTTSVTISSGVQGIQGIQGTQGAGTIVPSATPTVQGIVYGLTENAVPNDYSDIGNVALGAAALDVATTGSSNNTAIGAHALESNVQSQGNTAVGYGALGTTTNGGNTAVGQFALTSNTEGSENVAVGDGALASMTTGYENVAIGNAALISNESGYLNTAIGPNVGVGATGSSNVFIGNYAGWHEPGDNTLYISNTSTPTPLIYGNFDPNGGSDGFVAVQGTLYANSLVTYGGTSAQYVAGDGSLVDALGLQGVQGTQGIQGAKGTQGVQGVQGIQGTTPKTSYVYTQGYPSNTWTITHNLNFYPNLTIEDSAGSIVEGEVNYVSLNQVIVTFSGGFSGTAYLS